MHLYHAPNSAASQKVRLCLNEKGLAFEETIIDLLGGDQFKPEYREKNPNAVVPTLVIDGSTLIESSLINEYLDEVSNPGSLSPESPAERYTMRFLASRFDGLHQACGDLSYAILSDTMKQLVGLETIDAQIDKMPNERNRDHRRAVLHDGISSMEFKDALRQHQAIFDEMNERLNGRDWLVGASYSLADLTLAIYVARVVHLGLGRELDARPNLSGWFDTVSQREAWAATFDETTKPLQEIMTSAGNALVDQIYT